MTNIPNLDLSLFCIFGQGGGRFLQVRGRRHSGSVTGTRRSPGARADGQMITPSSSARHTAATARGDRRSVAAGNARATAASARDCFEITSGSSGLPPLYRVSDLRCRTSTSILKASISSSGFLTCPDIGTYAPISVYILYPASDIVPDIGTFFHGTRYRIIQVFPDIGYFPISGMTRYPKYSIPVHKIRPVIGSDIRIYGYRDMCIPISGHPILG
jgi:hypothetical protein